MLQCTNTAQAIITVNAPVNGCSEIVMNDCDNKCSSCHPLKMIEEIEAAGFTCAGGSLERFRGFVALKNFLNKMGVMKPEANTLKACPKCGRPDAFVYNYPTDLWSCCFCRYFCKRGEGLDAPTD